uniref:Interleukin-12 subunit alpha n=1 Tax=Poecilia latipinna TaxID=48699 RepID=A0A3B3UUZ7_9TELE
PAGFSSCAALMLMLMLLNWRTSTGLPLPLPPPSANSAQCASLFRSLLRSVTDVLKSKLVLSPQNSSCAMLTNSSFSENECVMNIMRDLAYYQTAIDTYLQSPLHKPEKEKTLLGPTLGVIQDLRKNCSLVETGEHNSFEDAPGRWESDSFKNRQKMCKMMRGFHVRAITINRAVGYISSGDHRK